MIIVGCGGLSRDILSFIPHEEVFFYDDNKAGLFEGYKILGTIDDLCRTPVYNEVYLGIGSVGDNRTRNRIYEKLKRAGHTVSPLIFPAHICHNVQIGENTVIGLNSEIHHDCVIGDNCVLSPRVTICGNVTLEGNNFIGAGAVIIQGVKVGLNSIVGAGSVVLKDIEPDSVYYGNPARFIRKGS
jgi:acetyltransferase-like isoleucine patch superfamily enzyme